MTIDPIGQGTYKGLAVPAYGESVISQQNSSNTIITLMHSTANTGRLLMGIDYKPEGDESSLLQDLAVFDVDAAGGYRAVSGTTIKMEFNSSGIFGGGVKAMDTSGGLYNTRPVVEMTTGASYSPTTAQSGTLFTAGTNDGTSQRVLLPKNPTAGVWYDFYVSTQDAVGDFAINTTANSSAKITMPGMTSAVSTADSITPLTSVAHHFVRLIAMSSVLWMAHTAGGHAAAVSTAVSDLDLTVGAWGIGTTSA